MIGVTGHEFARRRVVGKRLSIQNNLVSMDENRRSGFYPSEWIIRSQRPYTTYHIWGVYLFQNEA